jgi:hypothetical protein
VSKTKSLRMECKKRAVNMISALRGTSYEEKRAELDLNKPGGEETYVRCKITK